jgi:hypothetical protein
MNIEPIQEITAIKILREMGTEGSSPLLVMDSNQNEYYAKTTQLVAPRNEIINEIICGYALKCWDICVPEIYLIKIPFELVEQFNNEKPISNRYTNNHFHNTLFFGSKKEDNVVDALDFLPGITKPQFKLFHQSQDLLKIGVFDLWVGNKDRKPTNPNLLLKATPVGFDFCAIDHTAAFAYINNYLDIRDIMLTMDVSFSILGTQLARNVKQYLTQRIIRNLNQDILYGMDSFIRNYDTIVENVPNNWGFSKKAKAHLKTLLSNEERNNRIANSFLHY